MMGMEGSEVRHKTQSATTLIALATLLGCQVVMCTPATTPAKAPSHPCCPADRSPSHDQSPAGNSSMPCCAASSIPAGPVEIVAANARVVLELSAAVSVPGCWHSAIQGLVAQRADWPRRDRVVLLQQFLI